MGCVKLGEVADTRSETAVPAGGYKSVMSSMFCCNRQMSWVYGS